MIQKFVIDYTQYILQSLEEFSEICHFVLWGICHYHHACT